MQSEVDVLLVIVLYNQKLSEATTYKTLCLDKGEEKVFIWDNSPVSFYDKKELPQNVIYNHSPENLGLSYAYNRAVEYAIANSIPWVLLLDQDTQFSDKALKIYRENILNNPSANIIIPQVCINNRAYISPVKGNILMARPKANVPSGFIDLFEYYFINSGLLIQTDTFMSVKGYNEAVKLDFSDIEFIRRLRKSRQNIEVFVMPYVCIQNFSNSVHSKKQKIKRFELFCQSVRHCEKMGVCDKLLFLFIIVKRAMKLCIVYRTLQPFIILNNIFNKMLLS